jgi:hypothetical protein
MPGQSVIRPDICFYVDPSYQAFFVFVVVKVRVPEPGVKRPSFRCRPDYPWSDLDRNSIRQKCQVLLRLSKKVSPANISFLMFVFIDPPKKLHLTDYNL